MIAALRNLYHTVKAAVFGTPVENATVPALTAEGDSSSPPISASVPEIPNDSATVLAGLEEWSVHPYVDPVFEKVGRVFLDAGDLVIRSDRDSRGFALPEEDLDLALTGSTGTVRLLDSFETVGTAHLSTSGLALNLIIDTQLHTVPMRSLMPVLTGHHRKAPLFVPADDLTPDTGE
jgi:hypothetical protein